MNDYNEIKVFYAASVLEIPTDSGVLLTNPSEKFDLSQPWRFPSKVYKANYLQKC